MIPEGFLPFGPVYGDSAIRDIDDGSSDVINLGTDVIIFGTRNNRLYVSANFVDLTNFYNSSKWAEPKQNL